MSVDLARTWRLCSLKAGPLATCGGRGFALLSVDRVERLIVATIDDRLAQVEGLRTGDELRQVLLRFYPPAGGGGSSHRGALPALESAQVKGALSLQVIYIYIIIVMYVECVCLQASYIT